MSIETINLKTETYLSCHFELTVEQSPHYSNGNIGYNDVTIKLRLIDGNGVAFISNIGVSLTGNNAETIYFNTSGQADSDDFIIAYQSKSIYVNPNITPSISVTNGYGINAQYLFVRRILSNENYAFTTDTKHLYPNTAPTFFANKTNTTQTSISVAINSPVFYGEFSRYEYKIGSTTVTKTSDNDTSYAFTGLADNTTYQIVITCIDRNGRSTSVTLSATTSKYPIETVTFTGITDDKIYVDERGSLTITPIFAPTYASVKKLNVTVSNSTFIRASSDNNGVVTVWGLNKSGSVEVTLTLGTTDGSTPFNGSSQKDFTVYVIRRVTGVELSSNSALTLMPLLTFTPSITISPAGANDTTVSWASSDENVASVTDGVILGLTEGTATITVTTTDGAKTDSVSVTVTSSMAWEWGEPIYDRTQQDVIDAKNKIAQRDFSGDLKGCLNPSDINRIVNNIEYLALTRLHTIFGNVPNGFTYADKLNSDDIADMLNNINELKESANNGSFPNTPSGINQYTEINAIEQILYVLKSTETPAENAKIEYRVSNAFVSGATIFLPKRG